MNFDRLLPLSYLLQSRALRNPSPGQSEDRGEGPCKPRAMGARCVTTLAINPSNASECPDGMECRASHYALGRLSRSGRGLGRAASLVLQSSPEGEKTKEGSQFLRRVLSKMAASLCDFSHFSTPRWLVSFGGL